MQIPEVTIYSKPGCCLCEQAKEQLLDLQATYEFALREINILQDLSLYNNYREEIPVIFINGRKVFKYRLDEKPFIRLLKSAAQEPPERATPAL
jgi:glutaredoxin